LKLGAAVVVPVSAVVVVAMVETADRLLQAEAVAVVASAEMEATVRLIMLAMAQAEAAGITLMEA
jgi:hypothetical protein